MHCSVVQCGEVQCGEVQCSEVQCSEVQCSLMYNSHLRFKHAQPKMCHSPKVENGVDIFFLFFCDPYFRTIFCEEV